MVNHLSFQDDTIEAGKPAKKPRFKKYTKTRHKKVEKPPSPKKTWWRKNSFYQLLCCQNTCYSIALYSALVIFIALFVYAVWKICDLSFSHNGHKRPNTQDHASKPGGQPSTEDIGRHKFDPSKTHTLNYVHSKTISTTSKPVTKYKDARTLSTTVDSFSAISQRTEQNNYNQQSLQGNLMHNINSQEWPQDSSYNGYYQGEKRYMIPASPPRFQYLNPLDGSGGSPVDEWRAMRLALLRNRLKLTTGSSYPTENPYLKSFLRTQVPASPYGIPYYSNQQNANNIRPIHDDSILQPTVAPAYPQIPSAKAVQNPAGLTAKHSEINGLNANSSFGKGYTKLLTDLFNKMITLKNGNNAANIARTSLYNSGFGAASSQSWTPENITQNSTQPLVQGQPSLNQGNTLRNPSSLSQERNNTYSLSNTSLTSFTTTRKPVTTTVSTKRSETSTTVRLPTQHTTKSDSDETRNNAKETYGASIRKTDESKRRNSVHLGREVGHSSRHRSKTKSGAKRKHNKHKDRKHKHNESHKHSKHRKSNKRTEKTKQKGENDDSEARTSSGVSSSAGGSGSGIGSGNGIASGENASGLHSGSGEERGSGEGEQGIDHESRHHGRSASVKKHKEGNKSKKKMYLGLREKLMKLKKKHKKDKKIDSSRELHHSKDKKHHKHGHNTETERHHHSGMRSKKHRMEEQSSKHRKHSKKKNDRHKDKKANHKKHETEHKHKNKKKEHNNKHKYMNIVQQKLKRMKKKHQIAKHLSNVQKKLAELEKRKKNSKHHKKHDIPKGPKSLEMPVRRHDAPKHWKNGVVRIKDCSVVKEFDKTHFVGMNLYKKEGHKHVYVVTDCVLKKEHRHRYKCRKLFYKTAGYMTLKRSEEKLRRSKLYLVLCRHDSSLKHVMEESIDDIKKAVIKTRKHKNTEDDDDDDDDDDDGDKEDNHKDDTDDDDNYDDDEERGSKRSAVSRREKHSSHGKSHHDKKRKTHHNKHEKSRKHNHGHHREKTEHKRKHSSHKKRHHTSRHEHRGKDTEDDDSDSDASGSGEDHDDDSSGNEEERFQRSTTTSSKSKDQHKKAGNKKRHKKHNKHKVKHKKKDKHASGESSAYAKFFDMMKEMKQEIQNVTTRNFGLNPNGKEALNASISLASSTNVSSNALSKNTTVLGASQKNNSQLNMQKNTTISAKTQVETKPPSIQDMVAKIVPAIMQQFESESAKSNQIDLTKKTTVSTTAATTTTTKPTTTHRTTHTTPKPPTERSFKPTTPTVHKEHTRAHTPTRHVTVHHTTPHHTTHRHPTTKHASKPHVKTTQAPNIAMILKGLKALGLSQLTPHVATKKPSVQRKSVIPSIPNAQTQTNPKPPTKNGPTKKPPLPPPIPKPLPLHNAFQMHLLCFGDSLTAGYHNHGKAFSPYGDHLRQLIGMSSRIPAKVEIKGIVGEMTHKQMAARLPEVLGNSSVFDWVIILGGTNDILHVKNFADDQEFLGQLENVWQPRITKDIEKLHDTAHKHGAHSMLLTIPENAIEVWPGYKILLTMRKKINNALRQYALQHRDKVTLCDLAQKLPRHSLSQQQETEFWDDHLHMTPLGYNRMAEEVFKCLKPYFPRR